MIEGVTWNNVLEKYENNFFREQIILAHINELYLKVNKFLSEDKKPFKRDEFVKELADLFLLLQMNRHWNKEFDEKIKQRIVKFVKYLDK